MDRRTVGGTGDGDGMERLVSSLPVVGGLIAKAVPIEKWQLLFFCLFLLSMCSPAVHCGYALPGCAAAAAVVATVLATRTDAGHRTVTVLLA